MAFANYFNVASRRREWMQMMRVANENKIYILYLKTFTDIAKKIGSNVCYDDCSWFQNPPLVTSIKIVPLLINNCFTRPWLCIIISHWRPPHGQFNRKPQTSFTPKTNSVGPCCLKQNKSKANFFMNKKKIFVQFIQFNATEFIHSFSLWNFMTIKKK